MLYVEVSRIYAVRAQLPRRLPRPVTRRLPPSPARPRRRPAQGQRGLSHPNVPLPGRPAPAAAVGAILLSPLIRPGTVSTVPYSHCNSSTAPRLRTCPDLNGGQRESHRGRHEETLKR